MNKESKLLYLITSNFIIIFTIFFILIKPESVSLYPSLNRIVNILSIVVNIIIYLVYFSRKKFSKLQISIFLFLVCLFISTLIGTKDFYFLFKTYVNFFAISLYTELLILNNIEKFFKAFSFLICIYIILNFMSVVLTYPYGIDPNNHIQYYFLGYDNSTVLTLVLGLFFLIFSNYYFKKKVSFWNILMILTVFLTYYIEWAASCMICTLLTILYIFFIRQNKHLKKLFNFRRLFIIQIVVFLSLIVFRIQNYFSFIIVDILHKSLTLTGRTFIWDRCFKYIKMHPVLGLGVQTYNTRLSEISIYHAHSTLLNVLLEGGFLGLIFFLNIFRVVGKKLHYKNSSNEFITICSFALFIYFFATIIDVIDNSHLLYIFLNLAYYTDSIEKKRLERRRKNEYINS